MKTEFIDFPEIMSRLVDPEIIAVYSKRHGISKTRWEFAMFLSIDDPHVFEIDKWICKVSHTQKPLRMLINFDYAPLLKNKELQERILLFLDYYKLSRMFGELKKEVDWPNLKTTQIAKGIKFESWLLFFEQSYPKDYKQYLSLILKHFCND